MSFSKAAMASFCNEFQKIAGELQGHVRIGRKPISIDRMLEREGELQSASDVIADLTKAAGLSPTATKNVALMGLGAAGYHQGTKLKRRYDIGKQVEKQQQM